MFTRLYNDYIDSFKQLDSERDIRQFYNQYEMLLRYLDPTIMKVVDVDNDSFENLYYVLQLYFRLIKKKIN